MANNFVAQAQYAAVDPIAEDKAYHASEEQHTQDGAAGHERTLRIDGMAVQAAKNNLKGASIIVAGGYGVGSKEGFAQLYELARVLHAEVGASRAAVDAGFADHDLQIGQTGVTVRPKVYIACGISGAIQHVAGMKESGIIISINSDENAPINTIADYVITGTVEEVVPKLIKYYKQNSK